MSEEDKATDKKEPTKKAPEKAAEKPSSQRMVKVKIGAEPLFYKVGTYAANSLQEFPEKDAEYYADKGQLDVLGLA